MEECHSTSFDLKRADFVVKGMLGSRDDFAKLFAAVHVAMDEMHVYAFQQRHDFGPDIATVDGQGDAKIVQDADGTFHRPNFTVAIAQDANFHQPVPIA
jgi:hypothetical protein